MSKFTATAEEFRETGSMATRVLESALIRVEVAPARGGKFVSLRSKRTGTEWMLPPLKPYEEANAQGGFEGWDGGGFDECLPTVAATETAPDHGEVWRHVWQEEPSDDSVLLRTTALDGAVAFERRAHLDGASLILDYSVENRSHLPQSLLYCAHPLFHVEQFDRILLPPDLRSVTIEGFSRTPSGTARRSCRMAQFRSGRRPEHSGAAGRHAGGQALCRAAGAWLVRAGAAVAR